MRYTAKARLSSGCLEIDCPVGVIGELTELLYKSGLKHSGFVTIDISMPKRPRSTGPHSQNSCVWGWVDAIAEALDMDRDRVYQAMKRMAVNNGYPTALNELDGCEEPKSQSNATVEECAILLETIAQFAAVHGIALAKTQEAC